MTAYSFLTPFTFKNGVTLSNRIVMAPMTNSASFFDGSVTDDEIAYYAARNTVGLQITAVANVDATGKGFEGELSVAEDRFIPGLTKLASAMKANGAKAILQIFSAGRMTNSTILRGLEPVSASAIPAENPHAQTPHALTEPEVTALIAAFGDATRRAISAGFDGVEIHGANTYLLQQFFSPHSNRRTDQWGGSVEARMQLGLAVIKSVLAAKAQYGDDQFIVGYRISPEEPETPGIRLDDTLKFVDVLAEQPLDYLHVSTRSFDQLPFREATDVTTPINAQIKAVLNDRLPLIVVGGIQSPADVQNALAAGADLTALGRELIYDPQWVPKIIANQADTINYTLDLNNLDELVIPRGFAYILQTVFKGMIDFKD
ncbi:NADH-dependent flavin oxidoreductase [Periweissella ghanensis]|uniref:Oxidoreductase n=1 Tax=Periweissella ghanensis TaxID=467997 RepID=A0ABM8ZAS1_9LACO|nr:NADH-dependent flavin oxidoreductase [Periweissella ghanensis]MCM0601095.1 NADH-dependent flavin oxidoreductase [Periweissella ghanensis]CAH0417822.1 putative oxidoreductase [Periweissella ghanensis]